MKSKTQVYILVDVSALAIRIGAASEYRAARPPLQEQERLKILLESPKMEEG